jgi:transposase-like protein
MKSLSCPNRHCPPSRNLGTGAIIRHGFYTTRWGKRRRYQCQACGKTFCSTTGTPYYRIHHRRVVFDEVASLSVEGLNKSAIARAKQITWNTVHRWLERAAACCRRFSHRKIKGLSIPELQADEIRTIVGSKDQPIWVFVVIDVSTRLRPSRVVGKRSYRNTLDLFQDVSNRMNPQLVPFDYHGRIQVLRKSHRTRVRASLCLRPGDQDTQERSSCQSGQKSCDRSRAIATSSSGLGRLSETEHLVCRTAESHDPTKFSVSGSPNDMSGPVEGTSRRSPPAASLPLQFRQASSSIEIRTGSQNTSPASWID